MKKDKIFPALKTALAYALPSFLEICFLGITYGIYMKVSGFDFWYPMLMSIIIFAGSMEFVTVSLLLSAFNPLQAFLMTLMINARHLFYGISMLDRYRGMGIKKIFMIYTLCDESFSINYAAKIPDRADRGMFMFFVSLLNYLYWIAGATLGGIFGSLISFNTEGLSFAMTAMFVVIFVEQWLGKKNHTSELLGLFIPFACLLIFGSDGFLIPAMLMILLSLTLLRKPLEGGGVR